SGNRVVLESDVKKFRRNQGKNNNSGIPATVQEEKYNTANIVLSMYDADGNVRSPQHSPLPSPKAIGSRQGSRPTSPNPNPSGSLYPIHSGWASSGKGTHLTPPGVVPYGEENGEIGGYHSDHSDASHNATNAKSHSGGSKNKKKQADDAVDFSLLQGFNKKIFFLCFTRILKLI